uniref:Uncharacterized protein n=1 Tax=Rhizophora mucronata TaxID=61149 RepID=A0A2P2NEZ4_RHIMU
MIHCHYILMEEVIQVSSGNTRSKRMINDLFYCWTRIKRRKIEE